MNIGRANPTPNVARDLKRSALAVAMVLLKELDEAVPEEHGAQAVAALMLRQKRAGDRAGTQSDAVTHEHVNAVLLAVTATIGRLLDAVDDKCREGPLKPMLLFKIVEELAQEGYDVDCIVDFVRRAHAGASSEEESPVPRTSGESASGPALGGFAASDSQLNLRVGAPVRPSRAA
jgi:hypothetical protein